MGTMSSNEELSSSVESLKKRTTEDPSGPAKSHPGVIRQIQEQTDPKPQDDSKDVESRHPLKEDQRCLKDAIAEETECSVDNVGLYPPEDKEEERTSKTSINNSNSNNSPHRIWTRITTITVTTNTLISPKTGKPVTTEASTKVLSTCIQDGQLVVESSPPGATGGGVPPTAASVALDRAELEALQKTVGQISHVSSGNEEEGKEPTSDQDPPVENNNNTRNVSSTKEAKDQVDDKDENMVVFDNPPGAAGRPTTSPAIQANPRRGDPATSTSTYTAHQDQVANSNKSPTSTSALNSLGFQKEAYSAYSETTTTAPRDPTMVTQTAANSLLNFAQHPGMNQNNSNNNNSGTNNNVQPAAPSEAVRIAASSLIHFAAADNVSTTTDPKPVVEPQRHQQQQHVRILSRPKTIMGDSPTETREKKRPYNRRSDTTTTTTSTTPRRRPGINESYRKAAAATTSIVLEPADYDILCGRNKAYGKHPGNQAYQACIERWMQFYEDAPTKQEKMRCTRDIVAYMKREYNSRFVKQVTTKVHKDGKKQTYWKEISDQLARDKVSHALRFAAKQKKDVSLPAPEEDEWATDVDKDEPEDDEREQQLKTKVCPPLRGHNESDKERERRRPDEGLIRAAKDNRHYLHPRKRRRSTSEQSGSSASYSMDEEKRGLAKRRFSNTTTRRTTLETSSRNKRASSNHHSTQQGPSSAATTAKATSSLSNTNMIERQRQEQAAVRQQRMLEEESHRMAVAPQFFMDTVSGKIYEVSSKEHNLHATYPTLTATQHPLSRGSALTSWIQGTAAAGAPPSLQQRTTGGRGQDQQQTSAVQICHLDQQHLPQASGLLVGEAGRARGLQQETGTQSRRLSTSGAPPTYAVRNVLQPQAYTLSGAQTTTPLLTSNKTRGPPANQFSHLRPGMGQHISMVPPQQKTAAVSYTVQDVPQSRYHYLGISEAAASASPAGSPLLQANTARGPATAATFAPNPAHQTPITVNAPAGVAGTNTGVPNRIWRVMDGVLTLADEGTGIPFGFAQSATGTRAAVPTQDILTQNRMLAAGNNRLHSQDPTVMLAHKEDQHDAYGRVVLASNRQQSLVGGMSQHPLLARASLDLSTPTGEQTDSLSANPRVQVLD